MTKMLGIPLVIWGLLALALAAVWVFVWPAEQAVGAGAAQYFVLRWFHAIVWLLLAAAAFAAAVPRGARMAQLFGWMALAVYVSFLVVMVAG